MARTPLLRSLIELARGLRAADARGIPLEALREQRALAQAQRGRPLTRRAFMAGAAAATGALLTGCGPGPQPTVLPARPGSGKQPKIAIVGAGIAGLSAALELADKGIAATVYEAAGRVGGRMFSNASYFDQGQVFEWCGELIDTPHVTVLALAQRFGLAVDDLFASEPKGATETYRFFGQYYSREDAEKDFNALRPILEGDLNLCGEDTTFDNNTAHSEMLDNMSVYDWIEKRVPGGHKSPLGMLLDTAYFIELNTDTREQSSLNILSCLGFQSDWEHFGMYGESDEKFKIRGGNQQIPLAIAAHLGPDTLQLGKRMEAIVQRSSGDYQLTFRRANATETVIADAVLLTLPFAVLRELDYSKAGFDALKDRTIKELGRGRQSKQHLQFKQRVWNEKGPRPAAGTGTSYSDTGYQASWEASRGQPGPHGILVGYCGGPYAAAMNTTVAFATSSVASVQADAVRFLAQAEPVFPGLTAEWNGKATQGIPHLDPNFRCSYSHWKTGQYTTIRGYERVTQGRIFFAGEHTSTGFQGFMEGGAAEGQRAAKEILAAFGR
jgi:monoamine oxidase